MTSIRKTAACALGSLAMLAGYSQIARAQTPAGPSAQAPLAAGLTESGTAEAQVVEAVRSGDILSIKVRFKPIVPDKTEMIYPSITKDAYESSFYVIAGNKKHLLLKDSNDKPLTNPKLMIRTSKDAPIAGAWQGKFPAPPKEVTEISLTIPGVETIDAIKITDR
ncbi:hypothetical protein ACFWP0_14500 [Achromobacter sp. NPDC058515]|uniref:hypothetical protein n=1 Tax=Achromobacter sp. NPDC058515 TaxID=3346533 RepID=UPI003661F03F